MEYLAGQVNELKNQIKGLGNKCKKAPDDLKDQLKSFLHEAEDELKKLEEAMTEMEALNKKTAEYFCEDVKKFKMEGLLSEILNFVKELTGAVKVLTQQYMYCIIQIHVIIVTWYCWHSICICRYS